MRGAVRHELPGVGKNLQDHSAPGDVLPEACLQKRAGT